MTRTIAKIHITTITFLIGLLLFFPLFTHAQGSSPSTGITYECVSATGTYGNCSFNDLVLATQRVTKWLVIFSLQFSVIVIAWAGYKYMISGANPGKRSEANKMLTSAVIGIFFVLAAWFIVNLIANSLLNTSVPRII